MHVLWCILTHYTVEGKAKMRLPPLRVLCVLGGEKNKFAKSYRKFSKSGW